MTDNIERRYVKAFNGNLKIKRKEKKNERGNETINFTTIKNKITLLTL